MTQYQFSPYIKENVNFLTKLAKIRSEKCKRTLLLEATPEQILSIVEICANVLKNNFILTTRQRRKLAQYADLYRSISRSRTETTARNRIQEGGQLAIAAILAPVLSALAQNLLDKLIH